MQKCVIDNNIRGLGVKRPQVQVLSLGPVLSIIFNGTQYFIFAFFVMFFVRNHHVYAPGLFFLLLSSQETHSSQAHIGKRNVSERQRFISKYALQSLANEFSEKIFEHLAVHFQINAIQIFKSAY